MAGSSLFALIDDIASILDDIALMSKVAAKKTAGVLGDDLALNAQQVCGISADRELPVVWAVAVGSLKNKAILVPAALLISAFIPWAIMPLLMAGGMYLCYEGVEKFAHKYLHKNSHEQEQAIPDTRPETDIGLQVMEQQKIKGAIRTDFILSAEIIVIALGTVADAAFAKQVVVMILVAVLMTAGVYGIVAAIVKLDDGGLYLRAKPGTGFLGRMRHILGGVLLAAAPKLMKFLSVAGTLAMFMVGGGIITHGVHSFSGKIHHLAQFAGRTPYIGGVLESLAPTLLSMAVGFAAGACALLTVTFFTDLHARMRHG